MNRFKNKILILFILFLVLGGIVVFLKSKRYKIVEIDKGTHRIEVKIDQWTGKRYRKLYLGNAAPTLHKFNITTSPDAASASDAQAGAISTAKQESMPGADLSPLPPTLKSEASTQEKKASTGESADTAGHEAASQISVQKEHEQKSVEPTQDKGASPQAREPDCGFPVTTSDLINFALKRWCKVRQDPGYSTLSKDRKDELRSILWEKVCREGAFAFYWEMLSFEDKKELSRIYFRLARL